MSEDKEDETAFEGIEEVEEIVAERVDQVQTWGGGRSIWSYNLFKGFKHTCLTKKKICQI